MTATHRRAYQRDIDEAKIALARGDPESDRDEQRHDDGHDNVEPGVQPVNLGGKIAHGAGGKMHENRVEDRRKTELERAEISQNSQSLALPGDLAVRVWHPRIRPAAGFMRGCCGRIAWSPRRCLKLSSSG